jgi:hypothetical protein
MLFMEPRLGVEVDVDIPDGLEATGRLVPRLGYPGELCGFSNQRLPQTGPDDLPHSFPRVDALNASSMLVWLTVGDYAYDDGAATLTGPGKGTPVDVIRLRPHVEVGFVPSLSAADTGGRTFSVWPDTYQWARTIAVSPRHYVNLYAWVPGLAEYVTSNQPPQAAAALVGSITIRDYS